MTQRNYCADDIMGVLFIIVCITMLAITIRGILQFTSPETQKAVNVKQYLILKRVK